VSFQKIIAIPTIVLSAALTFAPLFAQEAGTGGGQSGNTGTTSRANDDRHPDYGWLGLVGLVGLAGLVRRDKDQRTTADRSINR
jgi:MYXO-CTERM domain-containing protein